MADSIKADLKIDFVGPFKPNTFGGGAYAKGIKPEMYAGFESPIRQTTTPSRRRPNPRDNPSIEPDKFGAFRLTAPAFPLSLDACEVCAYFC